MKNFKSGGRGNDREKNGFAGRGGYGGHKGNNFNGNRATRIEGSDNRSEMFTATCSTCGKACEVPFKPTGDRPVYCRDCFSRKNDAGSTEIRGTAKSRELFRESKPSFREERTPAYTVPRPDNSLNDIKRQLTALDSKLNRLLDLINPPLPPKTKIPTSLHTENTDVDVTLTKPKVRKPKVINTKASIKKTAKKPK